jgi:hypothetical protein
MMEHSQETKVVFGWLYFWLILICYERKILFHGWLILADKLKRTGLKCETQKPNRMCLT